MDNTTVALVDKAPAPGDAIRALIEPRKAAIIAKAIELAEAGDPRSLELIFKYIAPPAKPDAERVHIVGLRDAPTVRGKAIAIINAVAAGAISVEAGEKIFRMLDLHERAVTLADLAEQVAQLKAGRTSLPLAERVDNSDLA